MVSASLFKDIMAAAPGPVAVVTAFAADGSCQGLTASAVCAVSLQPPLLLVCLDHGSNTLAAIVETGSFTVNYLAQGQDAVALHFAGKSPTKFAGRRWGRADCGLGGPVLSGCLAAHAVCRIRRTLTAGDHVIVLGEVAEGWASPDMHALAYARRKFFSHGASHEVGDE